MTRDLSRYYNDLGNDFDAFMTEYDVERRQHLVFSTLLRGQALNGRRVLEVGSGTGRFSTRLAEAGADLTIVDIGENLVRRVKGASPCTGIVGDACRLPFTDRSFELVVSSECIEHTSDPEQALREMCRVCGNGGSVCITTPNKIWYPALAISRKLGIRKFAGVEHWISPRSAASVMRNEGMNDVRVMGCHLWPFQLAFTRPLLRRIDTFGGWLYPVMINFGILGRKRA